MARLACVLSLLLFAAPALADFLIEPYGGGQFSGTTNAVSGSSYTSFIYGGRVGFEYSLLSLGGEYLADNNVNVNVSGPNKWGADGTTVQMSNTNYGAFLAYEFMQPLAMRLIATYFFSSQAHLVHNNANTSDMDETLSGYGYKGELQARIGRYVMLGVSYYYLVLGKTRDNLAGTTNTNVPVDNAHAVMGTISIPLQF